MILFIVAFIGAITPGPDILLVLQMTLRYGLKRAAATLCGIASGWIIYLGILGAGLAHFMQSRIAQTALSAFGAVYLAYLAFTLFTKPKNNAMQNLAHNLSADSSVDSDSDANSRDLNRDLNMDPRADSTDSTPRAPLQNSNADSNSPIWKSYLKGLFVNLSNPKAIIFFSAIVAPFMDRNIIVNLSVLFCGLLSAFIVVIVLGMGFRNFINDKLFDIIDKICAILFAIFALLLAWRIIELQGAS